MDATTMNIHNQMKEEAKAIFSHLTNEMGISIQPGNYTAAEIEKQFNVTDKMSYCRYWLDKGRIESLGYATCMENYNEELIKMGYWGEPLEFSAGEFKCSIVRCSIFAKLAQWESAFRIPAKDKAQFTKEEESETVATFTLEIPKAAKVLSNYVSKDTIRPAMTQIYIDIANSAAVGSDTHILGEYPVKISNQEGEINYVWIDPKTFKTLAGQMVNVEIIKEGKLAKITTERGQIFQCEQIRDKYPDYRRVMPRVHRDGLFEVEKSDIKAIRDFAKSLSRKPDFAACVKLTISAFSDNGKLEWNDPDTQTIKAINFSLVGSPKVNVEIGLKANNLCRIAEDWNGCIWYCDPCRPLVFDSNAGRCAIIMPMHIETVTEFGQISDKCEVPSIRRHEYDTVLSEIHEKKEIKQKESDAIPMPEKMTSAQRYCKVKECEFIRILSDGRILAKEKDSYGNGYAFTGYFKRSGSDGMVIFEMTDKKYLTNSEMKELSKYTYYPVAICKNQDLINFWEMVKRARMESTINLIVMLMGAIEELNAMMEQSNKSTQTAYIDAQITNMGYNPSDYSGPAYVEFSDDCENWAGCGDCVEWENPTGTAPEAMTETQWESVEWNCNYEAPVNMETVNNILMLFAELSKIVVISEMSAKAAEIESMGMSAGLIPDSIPEAVQTETDKEAINTIEETAQISSESFRTYNFTIEEADTATGEIIPQIIDIPDESPRQQKHSGKSIMGRIFRKVKQCAAIFF